ncbi:DUF2196 domain-containing protein [Clostridioides difficile]|uniref:DUF2196 domain-containing protein n=1 Tax=Clostridioides difficile TaxID=1496 RepID=UPI000BB1D043|nr:DUF2196 domain-containing protein [Clostridioides difficile]PBF99902.1 hypothetical protein BGV00_06725 [Clostridioides difficile]
MYVDTSKLDNILKGLLVEIVAKEDKESQKLTRGYVDTIISKKDKKGGIIVELTNGKKGAVKDIVNKNQLKKENFKFYNLFINESKIYSIWDKSNKKFLVVRHLNKISGNYENLAYLFDDLEMAKKELNKISDKNYVLKPISRKKFITDNFKESNVKAFSINKKRKITKEKLLELEIYLKR